MFYAGVTEGASTTTLGNLLRGINGTTAATHDGTSSPATVVWGVACDDMRHWSWLEALAGVYLHSLFANRASDTQRAHHEFMLRYLEKKATDYEKMVAPGHTSRARLERVF